MNLEAIKSKLKTLNQNTAGNQTNDSKNEIFWKPTAGETTIRIVPYVHNSEYPFTELPLYYNYTLKGARFATTLLSPTVKGDPDPIVEFCEIAHKKNVDKPVEEWKKQNAFIRKMEPQLRTYVPIIIRGRESEGVKFWAFGKNVYKDILNIIADDDYGDITDPKTGHDLVVEYTPAPNKESFAKTSFRPRPKPSALSTDQTVLDSIKNCPDVTTLFKIPTYDELLYALQAYTSGVTDETPKTDTKPKAFKDDFQKEINEPTTPMSDDITKKFDDLFSK